MHNNTIFKVFCTVEYWLNRFSNVIFQASNTALVEYAFNKSSLEIWESCYK